MKNIVVFASGSGTNFINIYRYIKMGKINGKVKFSRLGKSKKAVSIIAIS